MGNGFSLRMPICTGWWRRALRWLLLWFAFGAALGAQSPKLLLPSGIAYDSSGNLFFADTLRNQIFELSLAGHLSVVAGTGEQGFSGDGGPALSAQLNAPQGVAVAADGTLYIADTANQRIRAVSGGSITTVAGTGTKGMSDDGGLATAASFRNPTALAINADGGLLICDTGNHRVRRVAGGTIATIAGTGVQGFLGDGSAATDAELDSPSGVAAMPDGRIIIADSHNHRLRVLGADGVIRTFAGTGAHGFSGDGGAATEAKLFLPQGISVTGSGDVLFADSDNHRIRSINAQGIISTVAGDGWQGTAADGLGAKAASLDSPHGVAAPLYGSATIADSHNRLVREVAVDGNVYTVAAAPSRLSQLTVNVPATSIYGQGTVQIGVAGTAVPQGSVALTEVSAVLGTTTLSGGNANLSLQSIAAGTHHVSVSYAGDGLNPAAVSSATAVMVQPAEVDATANPLTVTYGQAVPQVTGIASGVLAQDSGSLVVNFSTNAGTLAPVGSYPITAALTGAAGGNYKLVMSGNSGSLQIVQAQSTLALRIPSLTSYAGLPLALGAGLGSATAGVPTGEVQFLEGNTIVATAPAVSGSASGTYLTPSIGTHVLRAFYGGDRNFQASSTAAQTVTIIPMPDFVVSAGTPAQTVQAGLIASYGLNVAPVGGPFTGNVTFSLSGLPSGAQANFSPPSVVPGASGANLTLSLQTPAAVSSNRPRNVYLGLVFWLPVAFLGIRRTKPSSARLAVVLLMAVSLLGIAGCGARTLSTNATQGSRSFPLTLTATSTNVGGNIVTHTVALTLNLQ